jgi:D-inositol-3-phosphate glycosyltransferase
LDKADLAPLLLVIARLVSVNRTLKISLVLAGSTFEDTADSLMSYARELGIAPHVRVIAVVDPLDAHMWYAAADAFVSPVDNINETFGITVIEAMACGTPQIVSDWNGYRDTVVHGETGFLVPTRWNGGGGVLDHEAEIVGDSWEVGLKLAQVMALDLDVLQLSIQSLIDNAALRQRMAEESRRRAVERYSWSVIVREHIGLWRRLAEIAARDRVPPDTGTYLRPKFAGCFGHYATRTLSQATKVGLTRDGEMALAGAAGPAFHPFLHHFIDPETVTSLARWLRSRAAEEEDNAMFSTLCVGTAAHGEAEVARLERHVLWMAKHGLVRLQD